MDAAHPRRQRAARGEVGRAPRRPAAAINVTQDMSEVTLEVVLLALFGDDLARLTDGGRENPFGLLTDDTARNLAFAYKFRQLGKLILADVERRRRDNVRDNDIVSLLLDARDRQTDAPMSDRELLDEILTLIVAGHETTASSLNWFWYLLTQSPDVAARLHAEVDAGGDAPPGYDDLQAFPYTRRALDETLRLYPPGWLLTRRSIADSAIGGFALPAGTDVLDLALPGAASSGLLAGAGSLRSGPVPAGSGCIAQSFCVSSVRIGSARVHRRAPGADRDARARRDARAPVRALAGRGQRVEMEPQVNLRTRHPLAMHVRLRAPNAAP